MSEVSTPTVGKQGKTMSSRLLTMKFMQRAAASASKSTLLTSASNPINSPKDANLHEAKRQKLSSTDDHIPSLDVSSPHSLYDSDQPSTPWTRYKSTNHAQQIYEGNTAETPWVLNLPRPVDMSYQLSSPQETTSFQEDVLGRRTFGKFEKKTAKKVVTAEDGDDDDSLGSEDLDLDFEQHSPRMYRNMPQNGVGSMGKREKPPENDRMDSVRLKELKNGGLSVASGMRQPGFDKKNYTKNKRKA